MIYSNCKWRKVSHENRHTVSAPPGRVPDFSQSFTFKRRGYPAVQFQRTARLRTVPILPLEFVEPWKDIANAGAFRGWTNSRGKVGTACSLRTAFMRDYKLMNVRCSNM